MELFDKTISEMSEMLNSGKITSEELVNHFFDRIDEKEGDINAFISLMKDEAIAKAKEIDLKRKNGETVGKYAGIPIAIKDNMIAEVKNLKDQMEKDLREKLAAADTEKKAAEEQAEAAAKAAALAIKDAQAAKEQAETANRLVSEKDLTVGGSDKSVEHLHKR